jgi:hypothetical protein
MTISLETKTLSPKKRRWLLPGLFTRAQAETIPSPAVEVEIPDTLTAFEKDTYQFVRRFPSLVASVDVTEVLVPMPDRQLPRNTHNFSLVALTPKHLEPPGFWSRWSYTGEDEKELNSLLAIGRAHRSTPPARHFGNIYLDSAVAIALAYNHEICAIAAGGLTHNQHLMIRQIQGAKRVHGSRERYKNSGLHAGVMWRDTLVRAWMEVARHAGIETLELQSAHKNTYYASEDRFGKKEAEKISQNIYRGYDEVAKRMGFTYTADENWAIKV